MKRSWLISASLALSTVIFSTGCTTLERRLDQAAQKQGQAAAKVSLPEWPDDCRTLEPHAAVAEGAEIRSILVRERAQLDKANARVGRCADHYDGLRSSLQ